MDELDLAIETLENQRLSLMSSTVIFFGVTFAVASIVVLAFDVKCGPLEAF